MREHVATQIVHNFLRHSVQHLRIDRGRHDADEINAAHHESKPYELARDRAESLRQCRRDYAVHDVLYRHGRRNASYRAEQYGYRYDNHCSLILFQDIREQTFYGALFLFFFYILFIHCRPLPVCFATRIPRGICRNYPEVRRAFRPPRPCRRPTL